jgi:ABC-type multidrug transport system fused ATPase/permease subunit
MSKKSSDDKKASSNSLNFGRLLGIITRFSGNSRRIFLMAALMLILEALTALQIPNVIGYVVDYVTQYVLRNVPAKDALPASILEHYLGFHSGIPPVWETVALTTLGIIFLTMLNSFFDSLTEIYLAQGGRKVGYNMRVFLYGHLQKLSLSFYGQSRTGDLLTRVTSDIAAVEEFIVSNLADFLYAVVFLISAFGLMMQKSSGVWQRSGELGVFLIPLIAILILPVMALIMNYFTGRIKAASKRLRSTEGELASAAQEMLSSIRVVQVYGQGGYEQSVFSGQSQKAMNLAVEAAGYQARFSWIQSVLSATATALVICIGVGLILRNPVSLGVGGLSVFIKWIDDMFKPTKKLIAEWNAFGKLSASLERVGELMDLKPEVRDKVDAITAQQFRGKIEFRNVVFSYPSMEPSKKGDGKSRPTLNGLSFTIQPGQVVALVGHTGAGKSTVAQLLPRLYDPNSGQVLIDGRDIRDYTLESLRAQMSMVLQESVLFTGTIVENIAYGRPDAPGIEIIEAAKNANADEFISKFSDGYYTILAERGSNLSGGQRQRIAIARAFVRDTPILILDEPSTGLDAESTDLVLQALRKLMKGKTTIIISHELNLIRDADQIIVIKEGQIEQMGTHDELLRAGGLYANLYIMQSNQRALDGGALPVSEMADPKLGKD